MASRRMFQAVVLIGSLFTVLAFFYIRIQNEYRAKVNQHFSNGYNSNQYYNNGYSVDKNSSDSDISYDISMKRLGIEQSELEGKEDHSTQSQMTSYTLRFNHEACEPVKHVYFLKNHKCGSTTVQNVFLRYAMMKNLTMLRTKKGFMSYPSKIFTHMLPPPPKRLDCGKYDMLTEHSVYYEPFLRTLLPADTVNVAIVREPMSRLRSAFNYFKFPKLMQMQNSPDPVATFLQRPSFYISRYRNRLQEITQNWFAREFGFESHSKNLKDHLAYIESRFLVLVMEQLTESMIILKRKLCWHMKDVMFFHAKNMNYTYRHVNENETVVKQHKKWSPLEYSFYNHFESIMARKIDSLGQDFQDEVALFSTYLHLTHDFCAGFCEKFGNLVNANAPRASKLQVLEEYITFPASAWDSAFSVTGTDCILMMFSQVEYLPANSAKNFPENCKNPDNVPSMKVNPAYCDDHFAPGFPWKALDDPLFANKCY